MDNLSYHIKLFNDKVRVLNQTSGKVLTLTAAEAKSLHADIFDLLSTIALLSKQGGTQTEITGLSLDGGGFK